MKQCVWVAFCLVMLSGLGCRQRGEKYGSVLLSADTMKSVLMDVLRANAYNDTRRFKDSNYIHDTAYAALYESIFVSHHITREQFYDSYDYYVARPDEFRAMIDSMAAKASRDMSRQGMGAANPRPNGALVRPGIPGTGPGFNHFSPGGPGGHLPNQPGGHPPYPPGRQVGPDGRILPPNKRPPTPGSPPTSQPPGHPAS